MHDAGGEHVVERDDAIGHNARIEQHVHRGLAIHAVPHARRNHKAFVILDPGFVQRLAIALESQRGRTHPLPGVRANDGDAPAPGLQQIRRGPFGALDVLGGDVVRAGSEDALAEQHKRVVHLQLVDILLPQFERAEDEPIDHRGLRAMQHVELLVTRIQRRLDEHAQPLLLGFGDDKRGQLGEIRHLQIGNRQCDDIRVPRAQRARGDIHRIPKAVDRLTHFGARGLRDELVVVDDVRDRLDRHPRRIGYIAHGHRMLAFRMRPSGHRCASVPYPRHGDQSRDPSAFDDTTADGARPAVSPRLWSS